MTLNFDVEFSPLYTGKEANLRVVVYDMLTGLAIDDLVIATEEIGNAQVAIYTISVSGLDQDLDNALAVVDFDDVVTRPNIVNLNSALETERLRLSHAPSSFGGCVVSGYLVNGTGPVPNVRIEFKLESKPQVLSNQLLLNDFAYTDNEGRFSIELAKTEVYRIICAEAGLNQSITIPSTDAANISSLIVVGT